MARKKLHRDSWMNIRMSPEERAMFQAAAESMGLNVSNWVRMILREAVRIQNQNQAEEVAP